MAKQTNSTSGGIGFFGLLTIVFIVLKLTGYVNWGWVWVLAPLWAPTIFVLACIAIGILIALIIAGIKKANR